MASLIEFGPYRDVSSANAAANFEGPCIRLLKLEPGTYDSPLRGRLLRRQLYDTPDYDALSYSWGSNERDSRIILGDVHDVKITKNLELGLRRIRDPSQAVVVWVDMICINQNNFIERGEQVQLMAQIYSNARNTLVWLGETGSNRKPLPIDGSAFSASEEEPDSTSTAGPNQSLSVEVLRMLTEQQERAWWRRLWVVQECLYSSACPVILLGPSRYDWIQFLNLWNLQLECMNRGALSNVDSGFHKACRTDYGRILALYNIWQDQDNTNQHRKPLYQRVRECRHQICSDERDRIYAVLSISLQDEENKFKPDYEKKAATLFADATKHFQRFLRQHDQGLGSISSSYKIVSPAGAFFIPPSINTVPDNLPQGGFELHRSGCCISFGQLAPPDPSSRGMIAPVTPGELRGSPGFRSAGYTGHPTANNVFSREEFFDLELTDEDEEPKLGEEKFLVELRERLHRELRERLYRKRIWDDDSNEKHQSKSILECLSRNRFSDTLVISALPKDATSLLYSHYLETSWVRSDCGVLKLDGSAFTLRVERLCFLYYEPERMTPEFNKIFFPESAVRALAQCVVATKEAQLDQ